MKEETQQGFIAGLAERIQPIGLTRALDDRILVARVAVAMVIGSLVNFILLLGVQFWFGETLAGTVTTALLLVGLGVALHFLRTGNAAVFAQGIIWASVVTVLVNHVLLGGYAWSGGYVLWGISNIALAAVYLPRRTAAVMAGLYLIAAPFLAVMEPTIQSWRDRPDPTLATVSSLHIFIASVVFIAPALLLMKDRIFDERTRSRALMLNILPAAIADQLQEEPGVIAEVHDECSVLFADLVGFTQHSRSIEPEQLVGELNAIFTEFDQIVARTGGEKIKTIGDGYMAAFGVPNAMPAHAVAACDAAIEFIDSMDRLNPTLGTSFELRVGVAAGRAVAGVIGESKFAYDLWSDAVNLASRLESVAEPGKILVSEGIVARAGNEFSFEPLGSVELKGAGPTPVFVLPHV